MGAEAVLALMDATPDTEPCVISLDGNTAVRVPLMACVEKTQAVAKAMADKDWDKAIALRGRSFQSNLQTYRYTQHSPQIHYECQTHTVSKGFGPALRMDPSRPLQ